MLRYPSKVCLFQHVQKFKNIQFCNSFMKNNYIYNCCSPFSTFRPVFRIPM